MRIISFIITVCYIFLSSFSTQANASTYGVESVEFSMEMSDLAQLSGIQYAQKQAKILSVTDTFLQDQIAVVGCKSFFKIGSEVSKVFLVVTCLKAPELSEKIFLTDDLIAKLVVKIFNATGYLATYFTVGIQGVMIGSNGPGENEER